jgi:hypothetical protein
MERGTCQVDDANGASHYVSGQLLKPTFHGTHRAASGTSFAQKTPLAETEMQPSSFLI